MKLPGSSERTQLRAVLARDFRAFLKRGNVVDLAIGVMVGTAFGKIVSSFVGDILTPPIGLLIDEVNFSALKLHIGGTAAAPVTINFGLFLQSLLDFFIMAAALFGLVRLIMWMKPSVAAPTSTLTKDQELLGEIRDELRELRHASAQEVSP